MLTLSLLRHAKSSWKEPALPDHDRPLNTRGKAEAPVMGKEIAKHGLEPDLVLCSTARRTRDTLKLVLPELKSEMASITARLRKCSICCANYPLERVRCCSWGTIPSSSPSLST